VLPWLGGMHRSCEPGREQESNHPCEPCASVVLAVFEVRA